MDSPDLRGQTTLEHTLRVLRRRWHVVVICVVLVAGAAIGFSLTQEKKYTTSSSLLFQSTQFDQQLFGANLINPNYDPTQQQATNISLVSLPVISARAAAALNLPVRVVRSEVSVSGTGQSNIAKISVTDPDPARAALIANTYARQYVLFGRQAERANFAGAQRLVEQKLARLTPQQRAGSVGQQLENRGNQLGVLAALQTGNAQLVQRAGVPSSPSSPKTKRNGALGALLGLILGVGLVFLAERLDRRVREPKELEQIYGAPVLAAVPESAALAAGPIDGVPSRDLESFALLRSRLRYFNIDRNVRSLLVTSAAPGEGKSTVALNLALAEALTGERDVVLFEADLRRPSLAKRLGIPRTPGTAEIVTGSASVEDCLSWVEVPHMNGRDADTGFAVLTAGAVPPNPVELLASQALVRLLEQVMESCDLVVIDSPPMTLVSDAIPVVQKVSGVLVVARMGQTMRSLARHTAEQLRNLNAPTLGVVANAVRRTDRAYYFGYGEPYYGEVKERRKEPRRVRLARGEPRLERSRTRFAEDAAAARARFEPDWNEQRTVEFELEPPPPEGRSSLVEGRTQPNRQQHRREPWGNEEVRTQRAEQGFEREWSDVGSQPISVPADPERESVDPGPAPVPNPESRPIWRSREPTEPGLATGSDGDDSTFD